VEIDAASNNGVDDVRALRDEAIYSPAVLKKRVYIIDEVHMLSKPAFNALLKILEEPPEHLLFILATTELNKVPATILSRCQRYNFKRIPGEIISEYLMHVSQSEGMKLTKGAADILAHMAEGGMRDALSLLDQCASGEIIDEEYVYSALGLAGNVRIVGLLKDIFDRNAASAVRSFNELWMQGKDPASVLTEIRSLLRDVLLLKVVPPDGGGLTSGSFDTASVRSFVKKHSAEELIGLMQTLEEHEASMRQSSDPKTSAELCLITLCDDAAKDSLYTLKDRLAKLEKTLKEGIVVRRDDLLQEEELEEETERPEEDISVFEPEPQEDLQAEDEELPEGPEEAAGNGPREEKPEEPSAEEEPVPETDKAEPLSDETADMQEIIRIGAAAAPIGKRAVLTDKKTTTWILEENVLHIRVDSDFNLRTLNKADELAKIAEAVSRLLSRTVRVMVEKKPVVTDAKRDINELRRFENVEFIG
jgi:DNA polymerase-3 subunit gamma/tau